MNAGSLRYGAVFGFAGQVDRIVEEIITSMADMGHHDPVVVATGGLAADIISQTRTIAEYEPWLTLDGLRVIWERNTA